MSSLKRKFTKENTYPVSIEWIINEESLRQIEDTIILFSPELTIPNLPNIKCCIRLQQKRSEATQTEEIHAFLDLIMTKNMNISASIHMECKHANFSRHWTYLYTKSTGSGYKICNYVNLFDPAKNILIDKQLIIRISATLTLQNEVEQVEAKVPKIDKSSVYELWESEDDKDVTFVIDDGKEIKAHKNVLECRSSKFARLLNEPETTNNKIVVRNIAFDTVKEAVMHCYGIQGKESLSAEDATNMLIFANEYEIEDLKENMEEFCIENISVSNACLYANSSITAKAEKLEKCCLQFLSNCMKTGTAVKDIANLNAELKNILLLQSCYTVIES